jgi:hypothetical protein
MYRVNWTTCKLLLNISKVCWNICWNANHFSSKWFVLL